MHANNAVIFRISNRCLAWDGLTILIGTKRGELLVFDLVGFKIDQRYRDPNPSPITSIAASVSFGNELIVLTGCEDGRLSMWKTELKT